MVFKIEIDKEEAEHVLKALTDKTIVLSPPEWMELVEFLEHSDSIHQHIWSVIEDYHERNSWKDKKNKSTAGN